MVDMAHYAGLVAAVCMTIHYLSPSYVTSTTHKTLRGPRSGIVPCKQEYIKSINSAVFPGLQGGPLMHVVAGKAVCFGEALTDDFRRYGAAVIENAKTLAESLSSAGLRLISGGTDNH